MRHPLGRFVAIGVGVSVAALLNLPAASAADDDTFLRDFAETRGWSLGQPTKARPTPDGHAVLFLRAEPRNSRMSLFEFDVATGQTRELLTPQRVADGAGEALSAAERARRERMRVTAGGFADFQLSPDGVHVLLQLGGRLLLLNRVTGKVGTFQIGEGAVVDPKFSPDGRRVGYVRGHDVFQYDLLKNEERAVTSGGSEMVAHGVAEFVAQEEMGRFSGWWWSPDSKSMAYTETDASAVERWFPSDPAQPGDPPAGQFYPRPGKANVIVKLGIVSARGGKTRWISWDAARFPYLAKVDWHPAGGLTLTVQTRDQSELALLAADPRTGATVTLLTERDPAWVNLDQEMPVWLSDGSGFLWTSEQAGAWRLELRSAQGALSRVLVPPDAGYQGFVSVDARSGQVYGRLSRDPRQSHLARVALAGGTVTSFTAAPASTHNASFAENHSIYVQSVASLDAPNRSQVRRADGSLIGELPSVAEKPPFIPRVEWAQVADRGFYAKLVRPRDFQAGRRYPVLVHVYGGPGSQMVTADLRSQWLDQWFADQGFIVVSIDGRGTPGRGRDWERAMHRRFAEIVLADQAAGLEALGRQFPEMDLARVGMFGWSFGGYAAALSVLRQPEVFHAGVAIASVTDWFDYDTHYTERYLGVPADESDAVYRANSLLADAPNLRRPLLLMHGTADDNVFFRHSLKLADALFRAGKDCAVVPLKGFTHQVPEVEATVRLWQRAAVFFIQHLRASP